MPESILLSSYGCFIINLSIKWQNHNYAVDPASLPEGVEVTHINLNDGSCAGLAFAAQKIMSIQYHPEASPGPHDSDYGMVFPSSTLCLT